MEFRNLSKNLIDSISKLQLNYINFKDTDDFSWDNIVNSVCDARLFFSVNQIFYEKEYFGSKKDLVFTIEKDSKYYFFKIFTNESEALFFSPFIEPNFDYNLGVKINKMILSFAKHLNLKTKFFSLPRVNTLTENFKILFSNISVIESNYDIYVDLMLTENELWRSLRKSYKSLIKSTQKQIIITNDIDKYFFSLCKDFHHKIAERKTRNDQTWNLQFESIQKGDSKIFMAFDHKKNLLGFSLFKIGDNTVNYAVGVYDRDKFKNLAISHTLIWRSILFFKKSHKQLYLGNLSIKMQTFDKKLKDINHFKMGFTNKIISNPYLVLNEEN